MRLKSLLITGFAVLLMSCSREHEYVFEDAVVDGEMRPYFYSIGNIFFGYDFYVRVKGEDLQLICAMDMKGDAYKYIYGYKVSAGELFFYYPEDNGFNCVRNVEGKSLSGLLVRQVQKSGKTRQGENNA